MTDKIKQKTFSITLTCIIGWTFAFLATNIFVAYAIGLFIWLPAVMGITSTMLYGRKYPIDKKGMLGVSFMTLGIFCLGLLTFAWEGIICIIMAAPIGVFFTWAGHAIGFSFIRHRTNANSTTIIILLLLSVPSLMAFENSIKHADELRSVTTSIEIDALPETVWQNVISFPQLKDPTEFIFRTGIAYPINATIQGRGVAAVRHCNFTTGSFVEPITVWNEPDLLKFSVAEQPEPLKELSFYDIHPNHLHGFWVSKQGQFKLTQLASGIILLLRAVTFGSTFFLAVLCPQE